MANILVLEDDADLAALIQQHLRLFQHEVVVCGDGAEGLRLALAHQYDLLLLDLGLPSLDGLELCRKFRKDNEMTPIIVLSARNSELDRVLGLELGADDYLGKPFSIHELQARVKAQLRRHTLMARAANSDDETGMIRCKGLTINVASHDVQCRGQPVNLTAKEFDILYFLARNAGTVYNRGQLLDSVWGHTSSIYEHAVNSNINRLRNKIELNPAEPEYILTLRGVGYKFNASILLGAGGPAGAAQRTTPHA